MLTTELDIKKYFYVQQNVAKVYGVNITSYDLKLKDLWKFFGSLVVLILVVLSLFWYSLQHAQNMKVFLPTFAPFCEIVLVLLKISICTYKRREIVRLVHKIHKLSLQVSPTEFHILPEENAKDFRLSSFYFTSVFMAANTCLLKPVVQCISLYINSGDFILESPIEGSYPFERHNRAPLCFIVFVFLWIAIYFSISSTTVVESLYSWYIHNVSAHFRILQLKLDNFSILTTEREIKQWISYHQECLSNAKELDQVFSAIIFLQFTLNSIQIVLVAYQFTQDVSLVDLLFLISFLSAVVGQPAIYCYGGERLTNESAAIAMAIFRNIEWRRWPVQCQKLLQFSMMRAQKSCTLTGIFFVVNYNLFLWVLRTTASYMTVMKSMKAEGK